MPDMSEAQPLVYLNGDLVPRAEARLSVLDAGLTGGDGVWEGLRLHGGRVLFGERHVERLYAGARAIDLDIGMACADLLGAVELTCTANRMLDAVHIRLMVTRGERRRPGEAARPTVIIIAEPDGPATVRPAALKLFTAALRCAPADSFDMRLKSLSRLNLITAQLQAARAGADDALLLDPRGFVSTCAGANFFMARGGAVYTSTGTYCFNGITRAHVIQLCDANRVPLYETDFTLAEVHVADEAFVTGTFGGIVPVAALDGRGFGRAPGALTTRIRAWYEALRDREAKSGGAARAG